MVGVENDRSATVGLVVTFDLTNEEGRDASEFLDEDESARTDFSQRIVDRMRSVATAASDETGREMAASNPSVDLSRADDGESGIVTLTVGWSNPAAQDNGRLLVTGTIRRRVHPRLRVRYHGPGGVPNRGGVTSA